jgi:hypothetical protein
MLLPAQPVPDKLLIEAGKARYLRISAQAPSARAQGVGTQTKRKSGVVTLSVFLKNFFRTHCTSAMVR